MQLGITIPLQRFLRLPRPPYGEVDDLFFCWEAHRVTLGGRDVLLLANAGNRFAAAACMQPADWRAWEDVAVEAIRRALAASGLGEREIGAYLFFAGAPEVTRTHGRRPVAFLNVLVDKLLAFPFDADCAFPADLCRFANERLPGKAAMFEGAGLAAERFAQDVRRVGISV
ncbi:DUF6933 domain-containing protein [Gordonibacter massiliensis (ex Traore et al. 2017)]|uniref:DUF6933 domain-containing protein n=1 Tax=Gordonibacter massiliensis (ex Traore et al. 2017) TaxID=1841863 RepID=A0A842JDK0_9ACTN|nr:hypothetical protein [Gordonibacter massiliensis (ex Traore et al. 2017)]MBC2889757.1 hypothetical protein [Gordonibacter massiliensis (ex Traore et al. 2017)]